MIKIFFNLYFSLSSFPFYTYCSFQICYILKRSHGVKLGKHRSCDLSENHYLLSKKGCVQQISDSRGTMNLRSILLTYISRLSSNVNFSSSPNNSLFKKSRSYLALRVCRNNINFK